MGRVALMVAACCSRCLDTAQAAGTARTDVDIDDVMRFIMSVTAGVYRDDGHRDRVIQLAIDSVRASQPPAAPVTRPPGSSQSLT